MSASYSEVVEIASGSALIGGVTLRDANISANAATVTAFHNADNQVIAGSGNGLLTGGVAQLINPVGYLDRARETGFDGIPAVGIATGTQQTHQPYATTLGAGVSASPNAQVVALGAVSFTSRGSTVAIAPGATLLVDTGTSQEAVFVTAVNTAAKTITAVFTKNHSNGAVVVGSAYNQAKDATLGDSVGGAGLAASVTYIWDAASLTFSTERAATADAVPGTAVLIEAVGLWNGATFDRLTGSASRGADVNIKKVAALGYSVCTTGTVAVSSGTLVASGLVTSSLTVTSLPTSTGNVWLNPTGSAAVVGAGHLVAAGGGSFTYGAPGVPVPSGPITAISDNGSVVVGLAGG
jgi:hypothetical protein